MAEDDRKGFELEGQFYPWNVTTRGHDLVLIDRIAGIPPQEFFDLVEDEYDLSRAPVTLALIATSIRNRHPERSLERIQRMVMAIDLSDDSDDITFIGVDDGDLEGAGSPPAEGGQTSPSAVSPPTSNGSADSTSERSPETPDSSGNQDSLTGSATSVTR